MKRCLSLLLAMVMLVSMFSVLGTVAGAENDVIIGTEYTSMTYTAAESKAFRTYKNCNGVWMVEADGEGYTYKFIYNEIEDYRQRGSTLTFSGEGVDDRVFECTEGLDYSDGTDVISSELINANAVTLEDGSAYIEIEYNGLVAQQKIEILETPVESVEVKNAEIQLDAYSEGKYDILDFGENAGKPYFHYDTVGNTELEATVTFKDGSTATLFGDGDGYLKFKIEEDTGYLVYGEQYTVMESQPYCEWAADTSNNATIWFCGYPVDVAFNVNYAEDTKEIEAIEYERNNDKGFLYGIDGYDLDCTNSDCQCETGEYKYYMIDSYIPVENDVIYVKYAGEDEVSSFICDATGRFCCEENGAVINPFIYETQEKDHWEIGNNPVYVYLGGQETSAEIEVKEVIVESIEFNPENFYAFENTRGYMDKNDAGEPYFRYDIPVYKDGTTLTLTLADGEELVYECIDGEFSDIITYEKMPFEIEYNDNQDNEAWGIGEHEIEFTVEGCTDTVIFEVVENPIKQIEFIPAEEFVYVENYGGDWEAAYDDAEEGVVDGYYYYYVEETELFDQGSKLIITDAVTEEKQTYVYDSEKEGFFTESGTALDESYPVEWYENQIDEHWAVGCENYIYVTYMGHTAKVPVTVKPLERADMAKITLCTNGNGSTTITWNEVDYADSYEVYRREVTSKGKNIKGCGWVKLKANLKTLKYVDKTVEDNAYYKYIVHTRNSAGRSVYKSSKVRLVQYVPYITGFNAKVTLYGIELNWDRYPDQEVKILRRAVGAAKWETICQIASDHKYVCDNEVKSGKAYEYAIRAVSGKYLSKYSYSNAATFLGAPVIEKPVNNETGITVKWQKVAGAKSYRVYRRTGSGGWKLIKTTSKLSYLDTAVKSKSGVTYKYTVRAVGEDSISGYRSGVSVVRLTQPELVSAKSSKKGITVTWEPVKGAKHYRVYRKTKGSSWQFLGTSAGTAKSGIDTSAKKGVTYTYTIRAVSGSSISSYSKTGISCKDKY